jgi:hypothetical protein
MYFYRKIPEKDHFRENGYLITIINARVKQKSRLLVHLIT